MPKKVYRIVAVPNADTSVALKPEYDENDLDSAIAHFHVAKNHVGDGYTAKLIEVEYPDDPTTEPKVRDLVVKEHKPDGGR